MPYADPERQRKAARESAARRRAAARRAAASASRAHAHAREDVSISQHPAPDASVAVQPPQVQHAAVEPVSEADIFEVGRMLNIGRGTNEDLAGFRRRLRQRWALIRRVMAGGDG